METSSTLLKRVRDTQDQAAWGDFLAFYEPLLYSYVAKKGVRPHDAGDVVQNIFIALLRALPSFALDKTRGRFRTWLWQVTANAVTDWARARQRDARTGGGLENSGAEPAVLPPQPEEAWEAATRERIFAEALPELRAETDPKTWACFEQHVLKHRPGQEVGAELGLKPNTVYVNASRVLARLRERCTARMEELES
jgi:RNA polymerase sigma-70 factor (ECF subfamily)